MLAGKFHHGRQDGGRLLKAMVVYCWFCCGRDYRSPCIVVTLLFFSNSAFESEQCCVAGVNPSNNSMPLLRAKPRLFPNVRYDVFNVTN